MATLLVAACGRPTVPEPPAGKITDLVARSVSHPTVWLCRPDLVDDPCQTDTSVTVVDHNGARSTGGSTDRAGDVDCFYVYPTTAYLPAENAPLRADEPEIRVARSQAARFSDVCRVFAPVYRQYTLPLMLGDGPSVAATAVAYDDVVSAWHDYLLNDNGGRPFVLVGHTQGANYLARLIRDEIDDDPALRGQLVSALLIGADVTVAAGQDVGGDFANVPACRNHDRSGCVVAFSAFAGTPGADARVGRLEGEAAVGRAPHDGLEILCTNPAALGSDTATIDPYLPTRRLGGTFLVGAPPESLPDAGTAFVSYPGRFQATCRADGDARWLQIDDTAAAAARAADPRPMPATSLPAVWGLQAVEFNLVLGDLVTLVARQSRAHYDGH